MQMSLHVYVSHLGLNFSVYNVIFLRLIINFNNRFVRCMLHIYGRKLCYQCVLAAYEDDFHRERHISEMHR
jgi:hypothetical protein